jgi:hypothetical protein
MNDVVMETKTYALILVALLFAVLAASAGLTTYAQFEGLPYKAPIITVQSPQPNGAVAAATVPLNVSVQLFGTLYHNIEHVKSLNYSLDGQPSAPLALVVPSKLQPGYVVEGNACLVDLAEGEHHLTVYGETAIGELSGCFNQTVTFTVNTKAPCPVSYPFLPVLLASLAALVACVAVLVWRVYRRKRVR